MGRYKIIQEIRKINRVCAVVCFCLLCLFVYSLPVYAQQAATENKAEQLVSGVLIDNNAVWNDTDGCEIRAQGGCIILVGNEYNWIGPEVCPGYGFNAFNRYTSSDLKNWKKQTPIVTNETKGMPFAAEDWFARPWVFFHQRTSTYVIYCEWNNNSDSVRNNQIVVLTAPEISGPWKCDTIYDKLPDAFGDRYTMGDLGGFQDEDGNAYLMYTFDRGGPNNAQSIVKLDPANFRRILPASEGGYLAEFFGETREAASIIKKDSVYYYFTSDCLGWGPSMTTYRTASRMDGKWSDAFPVLTEPDESNSFLTQHDFILPITGTKATTYVYFGDRWSKCDSRRYEDIAGLYAWFPLEFNKSGTPVIKAPGFYENGGDWLLNVKTGEWSVLELGKNKEPNYDEDKVPSYILPDLLTAEDGEIIKDVNRWEQKRKPELLSLFSSHVYGKTPDEKLNVTYRILAENKKALNGKANCKQVEFTFSKKGHEVKAILILYSPNAVVGKAPVFVGYNFMGNETIHLDSTIVESTSSGMQIWRARGNKRGLDRESWPLELIIEKGFAVATMCYSDLYPDKDELKDKGVLPLFDKYKETKNDPQAWQAIGVWAWGLSRIVDFLENETDIDRNKIIAIGHSRLGKAALWGGAQDSRFSIVVSNNSGCGGAALFRRKFGETVSIINKSFPHWFCRNFRQYNDREEYLPIDQHGLIALMAPRPVYIASAEKDLWADPKGEFLSGLYANPVYALWGVTGMPGTEMPALNTPVLSGTVGYHIRTGDHDITRYDWEQYILFAQRHFK